MSAEHVGKREKIENLDYEYTLFRKVVKSICPEYAE